MKKKASYVMGATARKEQKVDERKDVKKMTFRDWKHLMESGRTRY